MLARRLSASADLSASSDCSWAAVWDASLAAELGCGGSGALGSGIGGGPVGGADGVGELRSGEGGMGSAMRGWSGGDWALVRSVLGRMDPETDSFEREGGMPWYASSLFESGTAADLAE